MKKKKLKSVEKINKSLIRSIIVFVIFAVIALFIILNKGNIFGFSLMQISVPEMLGTEELTQTIEVSVDKEYISVTDKETEQVIVKIDGLEATEGIEFLSSDDSIITVDETGLIKAKSAGVATITAKKDELAATVDVHAIVPIKKMTLTCTSASIKVGNDLQLKLTTTPSDSSIETITFSSSDESIATVNANGIVTGVSKGKVTITATDSYTGTEKSVKITIK